MVKRVHNKRDTKLPSTRRRNIVATLTSKLSNNVFIRFILQQIMQEAGRRNDKFFGELSTMKLTLLSQSLKIVCTKKSSCIPRKERPNIIENARCCLDSVWSDRSPITDCESVHNSFDNIMIDRMSVFRLSLLFKSLEGMLWLRNSPRISARCRFCSKIIAPKANYCLSLF